MPDALDLRLRMTNQRLLKNTAIYALGDIIPKVLSFFVFPILTAHLSLADYGIVNYVNTIIFLLTTIGILCLNTYYLVYYYKIPTEIERQKFLGNLSIFIVGLNLILSIVFFVLGRFHPTLFSSEIVFIPYIALGVGTNFFNILSILPSALYRVKENPLPLTVLNVLRGVLTTALTLVLVIHYKFTALGVLWSMFIVSAVFGIIFLIITLRNMVWNINWKQIGQALKFSLPLLPGSLAYYFLSMADRLFIERYLNLTDLGIYSTASTLAMILNIIAYGAYKAFEPHFFKIYGSLGFKEQFIQIQNAFLTVILFGAMGLSMMSREFFVLFSSPQYHSVYLYVPLVEVGVVFSSMSMLYATIVIAKEKTKINSVITIIGGGTSALLNITLLPLVGIIAACIASAFALGLIMVLSAYVSRLGISYIRPVLSFFVAVLTVWISVYLLSIDNPWLSILAKTAMLIVSIVIIMNILELRLKKIIVSLKRK